jgi:hypothetical protein
MSYLADDTAAIKARMEEIKAEKNLALTGSSAPVTGQESKVGEYAMGWPYTAVDDSYSPIGFNLPDVRGRVKANG